MVTRIHLLRHGRTAHNAAKRIQGTLIDDSLDEVGRAQASAAAARFGDFRARGDTFEAVYASPLKRAMETAAPVAAALGLPVTPVEALMEFGWGAYMGRVEEGEVARYVEDVTRRWAAGEVDLAPEGGVSPRAAAARVRPVVEALADRHEGRAFVIVAHGRINKILIADLVAGDVARMDEYPQFNVGLTVLERDARRRWSLRLLNDRAHFPTAPPQHPGGEAPEHHGAEADDPRGAPGA